MTDSLPNLSKAIEISENQKQQFRLNGHTLVRGILSGEEVSAYRDVITRAAMRNNTEKKKLEDRDTYGKAFLQIMNLWQKEEAVREFTLAKRFAKIAADLLGVSNVRIYHDQALFKEPGGGPTPWHQDQYYWPIDTPNTLTMWMPLIDIDTAMGMLTFASGSHKKGYALDKEISDESEEEFNRIVARNNYPVSFADNMSAGDATWHYGFTIHKAGGNNLQKIREVMTVIYIADGARITQPKNAWQENDRQTWLLSGTPGEFVNSELNPLLL